jgi:hypothetical protein
MPPTTEQVDAGSDSTGERAPHRAGGEGEQHDRLVQEVTDTQARDFHAREPDEDESHVDRNPEG